MLKRDAAVMVIVAMMAHVVARASTSSMKMMAGRRSCAASKRARTSFSDSPTHWEESDDGHIGKIGEM